MPIISVFLGILIKMFHDDHNPPHFHVEYAEHRAIVDIASGRVLAGKLPTRVRRLVEDWRGMNVGQLKRAWAQAQAGQQPRRIAPLA